MPNRHIAGMLTDIGVEELAHIEMVSAIIYQLTRNLTPEEIKKAGLDTYFVDHTTGVYPQAASGAPFTTAYIGVKGDVLADLHEDLAADAAIGKEQPAKSTLQNLSKIQGFRISDIRSRFLIPAIAYVQQTIKSIKIAK